MPSSIRNIFKTIFLETWTSLLFAIYRLWLRFGPPETELLTKIGRPSKRFRFP